MTTFENSPNVVAPVGLWWLDEGSQSGVWPCVVTSVNVFGVGVIATHPSAENYGEEITVPHSRVYDSSFNRPRRA